MRWRKLAAGRIRSGSFALSVVLGGVLVVAGVAAGCTGSIGDRGNGSNDDDDCVGCDPETKAATTIVSTRFPRLSHEQWENTIQQLFYLDATTGLSDSFVGDSIGGAFKNNESTLTVTADLWEDYQSAAEDLGATITADPALMDKIMPSDLPSEPSARARAFIEHFGARVYRRPLTDEEIESYETLFAQAPDLYVSGDDFTKGVRLCLVAFLQSPHFIYRVQASSEVVDHLIPLSGYEIATKLSYLVWNTMPDDELFQAAADGDLDSPEGIMAQAQRMLDDGRANEMVRSFHSQLYQYDDFRELNKSETMFPGFDPAIGNDMVSEAEMFVDEVVFAEEGGLNDLLTSNVTYVNAGLAEIYGLEGDFDESFQRVELDPETRPGFLTRAGFLASRATATRPHSILRGVFVNLKVLCSNLPAPPNEIPGPPDGEFNTNRELIEAYTGDGTCGEGCHSTYINPAGFAFENYDAIGQYQTKDNGFDINSSDTFPFDAGPESYTGAAEFLDLVAESPEAHDCYSRFWLEFGYGRSVQEGDELTVEELANISTDASIKGLILELTQTKVFRTRAPVDEAAEEEMGQ